MDKRPLILKLTESHESHEILKRMAEKEKKMMMMMMGKWDPLLDGLFKVLGELIHKRCMSRLDETDKSEQCLGMLLYLLQGTHDPLASSFVEDGKAAMDWTATMWRHKEE